MEILLSSKERVKAAQLKVKRDGSEGRFKYRERKQTGTGKEVTSFLHPSPTLPSWGDKYPANPHGVWLCARSSRMT